MCNIAGYIRTKKAAPILFEMIKKQEGYAGGYYAGIATINNNKILSQKLTGSVQMLENTPAKDFEGTIGVIHTRSNAGGGDEWAHPFLGTKNGEVITAYSAVGCSGYFAKNQNTKAVAGQLYNEGYTMLSSVDIESDLYPLLPNGKRAHMSDVMCQLIFKNICEGNRGDIAMAKAFCHMPAEIIGLNLHRDEPDRIAWAKVSEALFVSFASHGVYVSSSPEAFPEDAGQVHMLPPNSSGYIFKDHYTVIPFEKNPCKVRELDGSFIAENYNRIYELLKNESAYYPLWDTIKPTFKGADVYQVSSILNVVIEALKRDNKLEMRVIEVDGAKDGIKAKQCMFKAK